MYALFKDGMQISKAKISKSSALWEAFKYGIVISSQGELITTEGYTIEEVKE